MSAHDHANGLRMVVIGAWGGETVAVRAAGYGLVTAG